MSVFDIPELELDWQFDVNQLVVGATRVEHHQKVLWAIKESMIGFAANPWTVKGSADTVTAGMDDVDRWDTYTDIHFTVNDPGGTSTRSWIVLQDASGCQVLLDCRRADNPGGSGNDGRDIYRYWSPSGGFSGGSTSSAPTATDQILLGAGSWLGDLNSGATFRVHVLMDTTGKNTIVLCTRNNLCTTRWLFFAPAATDPDWLLPYVGDMSNDTDATESRAPTYAELYAVETFAAKDSAGGTVIPASASTWTVMGQAVGQYLAGANPFSGQYPLFPIGLVCTTAPARARLGRIQDVFFGLTTNPTGTSFPDDASYAWVQFGDLIVPWSGDAPEIT